MSLNRLITIVLTLLTVSISHAQSQVTSPTGWSSLIWGMNEGSVAELLGKSNRRYDKAVKYAGWYSPMFVEFKIAAIELKADLLFSNATHRFEGVNIRPKDDTRGMYHFYYDTVLTRLIQKYGPPHIERHKELVRSFSSTSSERRTAFWLYQTTTIELSSDPESLGPGFGIFYREIRNASELDSL